MFLTAAIVLTVLTVVFVLFIRPSDLPPPEPVLPTEHLEHRKGVIYDNLRDLTFEYRLGKLSEADYNKTKLSLQKELASVMAEIDAVVKGAPAPAAPAAAGVAAKADPLQCPHCGARFEQKLKFCGECGKPMGAQA